MAELAEALLVAKTSIDQRLAALLAPTIEGMGYALIRVRLMGAGGKDTPLTLQIMAERPDGTMEIDDCAEISHALSAILDVEDPIEREYSLEVSSPGIDRPLTRQQDFIQNTGHKAKIDMATPIEGRKRFKGELQGIDSGNLIIQLDDLGLVSLPLLDISDAKLIITDALIQESLRKQRIPDASAADETEYDTEEHTEYETESDLEDSENTMENRK